MGCKQEKTELKLQNYRIYTFVIQEKVVTLHRVFHGIRFILRLVKDCLSRR